MPVIYQLGIAIWLLGMVRSLNQLGDFTILSHLKIKGIIADPSHPDATIGEFKGRSAFIQHAIKCDPHAQCPDCQTKVLNMVLK